MNGDGEMNGGGEMSTGGETKGDGEMKPDGTSDGVGTGDGDREAPGYARQVCILDLFFDLSETQLIYPLQDGIRLPFDIISVIARILENGKAAKTLAELNRTCRIVHQDTLPILYECLTLETEKHFSKIVGFSNPKGWKWVKWVNGPHRMTPC